MLRKFVGFFFKSLIAIIVIGAIGAGITVATIIDKYTQELPDVKALVENYTPALPTTVYDKDKNPIDVLSREERELSTLDEIPTYVRQAFISIEDKRFYEHYGIDPVRVLGAVLVNVNEGRSAQGASTLTQQLARNAFLTAEKSMARKIKEAIITLEIERNYTKDEILEKYLNEIYFGGGAYGIKSAAKLFFQKDLKDLNVAEGALLAGIPNRPELYNPRRNLDRALQREKLVLAQMYKDGVIDKSQYDRAMAQKFVNEKDVKPGAKLDEYTTVIYNKKPKINSTVPAYTDMVEEFLLKNFDENLLYTGGLKVYTPLDMRMQKVAEDTFTNYPPLKNDRKLQGAMISMESNTGNVVSIVGGKNFKVGNFNRATMARRQLGSSFKPLIYFTAINEGMEPNTIVEDSRIVFGNWAPRNYGGRTRDNVTLVEALDKSINMVSIKLLQKVGEKKLNEVVKATGANFKIPNNLTAALGSFEGTPMNLARAYAPFSNGGYAVEPTFVTRIEDSYGNTIYKAPPVKERVFESDAIGLMTYMLKSSVKYGTSRGAAVKGPDGQPIEQGGKTGTTNEARTVWFAGITPDYVTTIYLGYDDNKPQSSNATGGGLVSPLWHDYYQKLIDDKIYVPSTKFEFLEDHIKNGDLIYQNLDLNTGLINNTADGRGFLLRKNKRELEYNGKYSSGIGRFFRGQNAIADVPGERKDMGTQETSVSNDSIFNKLLRKPLDQNQ